MLIDKVVIESLEYVLPDEVWTSEDIETKLAPVYERLKLPLGRLELMTGIKERRFWPVDMKPSEASAMAGKKALAKSNIDKEDIGLLIHAGVCRDHLEPATAANVHNLLGLSPEAQILDVSNACLGFLNAMHLASGMIQSGQIKSALIVTGENGRPLLEHTLKTLLEGDHDRKSIKPFFANFTIGAGAVAIVLTHEDSVDRDLPKIVGVTSMTDSTASTLCQGGSAGDHLLQMQTDVVELLEAGVSLAKKSWAKFKKVTGWAQDTAERIICHQVGKQHQRKLFEALGIPIDRDFPSYETLGNMGSASLPITLAMALEEGAILPGDSVALLGIGSGISTLTIGLNL